MTVCQCGFQIDGKDRPDRSHVSVVNELRSANHSEEPLTPKPISHWGEGCLSADGQGEGRSA